MLPAIPLSIIAHSFLAQVCGTRLCVSAEITKQTITSVRRAHPCTHRIARKAITTDGQDVMFLHKAVYRSIRHFMSLFWLKYLWYKILA